MRTPRSFAGLALATLLAASQGRAATSSDDPPSAVVETSTPAGELLLSIRKWVRSDRGRNNGLIVWYQWEDKAKRRANVIDSSSSEWLVRFADRPEVGKQGNVEYTYVFELSAEQRALLEKTVRGFEQRVVEYSIAIADPWTKLERSEDGLRATPNDAPTKQTRDEARAAFEEVHAKEFAALAKALEPLSEYTDREGNPAATVMLKAVGFEPDPASAAPWKPSRASSIFAANHTRAEFEMAREGKAWRDERPTVPDTDPCFDATQERADIAEDVSAAVKCSAALKAELPNVQELVNAQTELSKLDVALAALSAQVDDTNVEKVNLARSAFAAELDAATQHVDLDAQTHARALKALVHHMRLLRARQQGGQTLQRLQALLEETRRKVTISADARDILKQEGSRRDFDIASGLVYVAELDEWVVPMLVAWCPWGCHRPESGFDDFRNMWSVDAGFRVRTLDSGATIDRRHDTGTASLMLGLSLNPASFFRLSVGDYIFNNSQTRNWNSRLYFGFSMDLVRLAEVSKLVGLGEPPKPKIEPASK